MKKLLAFAASAALLAAAGHAAATEYVVNGGFENPNGDHLAGWTRTGADDGFNYVSDDFHTGLFAMQEGNYPSDGLAGLSQQLATSAGVGYDISLWWKVTGSNTPNDQLFEVIWDGNVIGSIGGAQFTGDFTQLTYHVTGAGNDTLAFDGYSNHGFNIIDDVSVVGNGVVVSGPGEPGGVPEPASWALMIGGFGFAGAALRRRRAASAAA